MTLALFSLQFTGPLAAVAADPVAAEAATEEKPNWLLNVAADEESLEKRIAAYIRDVHEIEAEYKFAEENDLYLKYMFTSDEQLFPAIPLFVDTEPSNEVTEDEKTVITERRVTLSAFYVLPPDMKTMENRQYLLELINEWHTGKWEPQRIYLDVDGDITLQSSINVPGEDFQVHAELIVDQIYRMYSAWGSFYETLSSAENLPVQIVPAESRTMAASE